MVLYSEKSEFDFMEIINGLANWKKHPLEYDHAMRYADELKEVADEICKMTFHRNCTCQTHKKYGEKVFVYKLNKQTQWNVIYDWDKEKRITYVNKIINKYQTVSGLR